MHTSRQRHLFFAISALLLASLACQTLLAPEEIFEELPTSAAAQATPTNPPEEPSPPPTPAPIISQRLNSERLPVLSFGPVGASPAHPNRPALSGTPQSLDTAHFRIHYSLSGDDAVPAADEDGNGHPEFVQEVAVALEYAWFAIIDHFGWAAPPVDEGIGGDDLYDVYLENIFEDGTAGYTEGGFADTIVGDNPNSAIVESDASHSYMALDNDYAEFEDYAANGITAIQFMRSTAAHEFLHAVQYGYDSVEPHDWLWEASANWIQDEVLDDYNDSIEDLSAVFKSPDSCQLAYGGEERLEDENHWYGLWIFFRYYSELYGHQAVIDIWESAAAMDGYAIWDEQLSARGSSLQEFFRNYSVALLLRDFEEGASYPTVRLEGEAMLGSNFTPLDGVGQMGADYVRILADGNITLRLAAEELQGLAVAISADRQAHLFPLNGGQASLNAADYEYLYLIVINQGLASGEGACRFTDYIISVEGSGAPGLPSLVRSASNFEAPRVESLSDAALSGNEPPADLALVYIPNGYAFAEAYEQAREDFYDQENLDYYIPGAGPVTVLDYYGPGDEDFVGVYESASPFANLDAFFADTAYEPLPGERQQIEGFDVLIEDYAGDAGPFSIATFIIGEYFYVIEGSITTGELINVVAAWLLG